MNDYDKLYLWIWGSSDEFHEFPYAIAGVNILPEYEVGANDVYLDAYTSTAGYTVRNRKRHNVASLNFNVPTMIGYELNKLLSRTTNVWLECRFFY